MNWSQLEPKIENLQQREVSIMNRIEQLSSRNARLPQVSMSFTAAKNLIAGADYNVVVCGEVKKGKSSLLNAIIGQEILPVNNEIATSQVFRVSNSSSESFCLVFTDGTVQNITKSELARYGSQVDANLKGEPVFQNRTLRYIQVNVPIAFLPKGVSLVDTPGLGALYKSHEWITQNYVRNADAIIFVLDPERPVEEQEKKFILKALDVTDNIIFVMTKIDLYQPEVCSMILQRNESLLADIFASKGKDMPQIMPVSSLGLMKASTSKVKALSSINLKNSKFLEVKEELMRMIFRGVGILRTGQALSEAANQVTKCKGFIDDMRKACVVDNQKEQAKIAERKIQQQQKLQASWGANSQQRQDALNEINAICASVTSRVQQLVSPLGSIYKEYEEKINRLSTMDEVRRMGNHMAEEVANDVSSQWQSIANQTSMRVAAVLSSVSANIGNIGISSIEGTNDLISVQDLSFMEKMHCWRSATFVGGIGMTLASSIGAFAVPIIGPIVGIGLLIGSWLFGRNQEDSNQVERNKVYYKQKLAELLGDLSVKLLHVQGNNVHSVVGQFTYDLSKNAQEAINSIVQNKKTQMQKDMEDFERQVKADTDAKRRDEAMWCSVMKEWEPIVDELKQLIAIRKQIQQSLL